MNRERTEAINALKYVFDFAERERDISLSQAEAADERKDYRQGDRDTAYSLAMQKVRSKCIAYAREHWLRDITQTMDRDAQEAWPMLDVFAKLTEAAEMFLGSWNYDGHGHEELIVCVDRAKTILAAMRSR